LDVLVFTGGIGENAAPVRELICTGLSFMGIKINQRSNRAQLEVISAKMSRVKVKVMKTNEEMMIARHTQHIINQIY
jgi:acetate kinase